MVYKQKHIIMYVVRVIEEIMKNLKALLNFDVFG